MQVYLIRHGETDWNLEGRCQGISDTPLNETGRSQARAIAGRLCGIRFEAFYASSLSRALETAQIVAEGHGHPVRASAGLRELDQGDFEGCCFTFLRDNYGAFLKEWRRSPAELVIPGGESLRQLQKRAGAEIERIVRRHPEGKVAVFAHNLCNATLLCWALKLDLNDFRHIRQDVAALNIIEFPQQPGHPIVVSMNDTCHLAQPEGGVSR